VDLAGGLAKLTVQSGAIGNIADDFGFLHRQVTGDFVIDAHQVAAASTFLTTLPASTPGYSRLIRLGDTVVAHGSSDAQHWHDIGQPGTFDEALGEDVRVGIALAVDAVATAWVEIDWLRIRPAVKQEPMVYVKPEQGPF